MDWYTATVTQLVKESPDAISISLEQPEDYDWKPGQHIQVKVSIKGEEYKRAFSISSGVNQPLRLTVKQSSKGIVSKFFNSKLKVGDAIQISRPAGRFCHSSEESNRRSYYFFAAGSGITPIYAMMVHILALEPQSYVYLLYGNKNAKHTIFKQQLDELALEYADNLVIKHCHSSPSWVNSSPWYTGRVESQSIIKFIQENPPYAQNCHYYICGPDTFIPNVQQALSDIDVPNSCIYKESFGGNKLSTNTAGLEAALTVQGIGQPQQLKVAPKQSLLHAMQAQKLDVPYSCEAGVCGTCQCRIVEGEVTMLNNSVLSKKEVKQGKILACQAFPKTAKIEISYD